jgi:hypothetical protein
MTNSIDTLLELMNERKADKLNQAKAAKKAAKQRILNKVYDAALNTKKYYQVFEQNEWGDETEVFTYNKKTALNYMKERTAHLKRYDLNCSVFLLNCISGDDKIGVDTKYSFFN